MKTPKEIYPNFTFDISELFPLVQDSSHLLVGTGHDDFMASRIAHAVEDADANLINMNLTAKKTPENKHIIEIRVNHRDPERVARSLERYGYNILETRSDDGASADQLAERLDELMHYIYI